MNFNKPQKMFLTSLINDIYAFGKQFIQSHLGYVTHSAVKAIQIFISMCLMGIEPDDFCTLNLVYF